MTQTTGQDIFGAANDLIGGVSSFLSGQAIASGSKKAEAFYKQAAQYSQIETGLKGLALQRQLQGVQGGARAAAGASGLALSGSVTNVIRSNAQQGALSEAVVRLQGDINTKSYMAMAADEAAKASAANSSSWLGAASGILGAAGQLAPLIGL